MSGGLCDLISDRCARRSEKEHFPRTVMDNIEKGLEPHPRVALKITWTFLNSTANIGVQTDLGVVE